MILLILWVVLPLGAGAVLFGLQWLICWRSRRLCWVLPLAVAAIAFFAVRTGLQNNDDVGYLLSFFYIPHGVGWTAGLALGTWRGFCRPPRARRRRPRTLRESRRKRGPDGER